MKNESMDKSHGVLVLAEYYSFFIMFLYSIGKKPTDPRYTWVSPTSWEEKAMEKAYGELVVLLSYSDDAEVRDRMAAAVQFVQGNGKKAVTR